MIYVKPVLTPQEKLLEDIYEAFQIDDLHWLLDDKNETKTFFYLVGAKKFLTGQKPLMLALELPLISFTLKQTGAVRDWLEDNLAEKDFGTYEEDLQKEIFFLDEIDSISTEVILEEALDKALENEGLYTLMRNPTFKGSFLQYFQ